MFFYASTDSYGGIESELLLPLCAAPTAAQHEEDNSLMFVCLLHYCPPRAGQCGGRYRTRALSATLKVQHRVVWCSNQQQRISHVCAATSLVWNRTAWSNRTCIQRRFVWVKTTMAAGAWGIHILWVRSVVARYTDKKLMPFDAAFSSILVFGRSARQLSRLKGRARIMHV